jgi:hypothetical protein
MGKRLGILSTVTAAAALVVGLAVPALGASGHNGQQHTVRRRHHRRHGQLRGR